ncbi:keratin, type I cytoskeletal 19-like [Hyla sarda]|uniref:keratin, type I cytoskeletal 19-like n=1 Tax=Hyla sarda TaxID=327740 RepID=UPI0024C43529|nr:keratin, type I cytoskeletal 19-like [Hyla sarda]
MEVITCLTMKTIISLIMEAITCLIMEAIICHIMEVITCLIMEAIICLIMEAMAHLIMEAITCPIMEFPIHPIMGVIPCPTMEVLITKITINLTMEFLKSLIMVVTTKKNSSGLHSSFKADGLFDVNEKEIMQLLNERLSSYLGEVRTLEMENAQLERKICQWYENNPPKTPPDGTEYFKIIDKLQDEIIEATLENANIMLEIDNARLAAADYRSKYEQELAQSNNMVVDMNNLGRVLEALSGENNDLEMHVQSLQGEVNNLKSNSEEEIESLLSQLGARINVEMNAAPSIDLNEALSEIREEYETLMQQNLKEAEDMFLEMSQELSREVASSSEQLQSIGTELIEMKRCVQALEIELQSELSLKSALEGTLAETEAAFGSKLAELQCLINNMEADLASILSNLERQNYEYKVLMDQKTHLEMEIATYKRLLDGHDIDISTHDMSHGKHGHHTGSYHHLKHHGGKHHSSGNHHGGHHHESHHFGGHHHGGHHHESHHFGGHHHGGHQHDGHHFGGHHHGGHQHDSHHFGGQHHGGHHSSGHQSGGHHSSSHEKC